MAIVKKKYYVKDVSVLKDKEGNEEYILAELKDINNPEEMVKDNMNKVLIKEIKSIIRKN